MTISEKDKELLANKLTSELIGLSFLEIREVLHLVRKESEKKAKI